MRWLLCLGFLPAGFARMSAEQRNDKSLCLPKDLSVPYVFALLPTCATGRAASAAIRLLATMGVREEAVFVLALVMSSASVASICANFPSTSDAPCMA